MMVACQYSHIQYGYKLKIPLTSLRMQLAMELSQPLEQIGIATFLFKHLELNLSIYYWMTL